MNLDHVKVLVHVSAASEARDDAQHRREAESVTRFISRCNRKHIVYSNTKDTKSRRDDQNQEKTSKSQQSFILSNGHSTLYAKNDKDAQEHGASFECLNEVDSSSWTQPSSLIRLHDRDNARCIIHNADLGSLEKSVDTFTSCRESSRYQPCRLGEVLMQDNTRHTYSRSGSMPSKRWTTSKRAAETPSCRTSLSSEQDRNKKFRWSLRRSKESQSRQTMQNNAPILVDRTPYLHHSDDQRRLSAEIPARSQTSPLYFERSRPRSIQRSQSEPWQTPPSVVPDSQPSRASEALSEWHTWQRSPRSLDKRPSSPRRGKLLTDNLSTISLFASHAANRVAILSDPVSCMAESCTKKHECGWNTSPISEHSASMGTKARCCPGYAHMESHSHSYLTSDTPIQACWNHETDARLSPPDQDFLGANEKPSPSISSPSSTIMSHMQIATSKIWKPKPATIYPPRPQISIAPFSSHLTPALSQVCTRAPLDKYFYPSATIFRPIHPLERGHWRIPVSDWTSDVRGKFWSFMHRYLSSGKAGWGVWCVWTHDLDVPYEDHGGPSLCHPEIDPTRQRRSKNESPAERRTWVRAAAKRPFYTCKQRSTHDSLTVQKGQSTCETTQEVVKLYCWGEVVRELYIVLLIASGKAVRHAGVTWYDSRSLPVVMMD